MGLGSVTAQKVGLLGEYVNVNVNYWTAIGNWTLETGKGGICELYYQIYVYYILYCPSTQQHAAHVYAHAHVMLLYDGRKAGQERMGQDRTV